MNDHPLTLKITKGGLVVLAFHPSQARQADAILKDFGQQTADERGGHVLPASPLKRAAFKALRRVFKSQGRVSDWTRNWEGPWIIVSAKTGERLPGSYASHRQAVRSEVDYIIRGNGDIVAGAYTC